MDQFVPENPAYNVPVALRLRGALDLDALERSLHAIVERHAALRTTFATVNSQPVQRIAPAAPVPLRLVDLSDAPAAEQEQALHQQIRAELLRPFDLQHGPLVRVTLFRRAADEHILLLMLHHIIFDGWSVGVLHQELRTHYNAYHAGREPAPPELAIQCSDYAYWQREQSQTEQLAAHLRYWTEQLAGAPSLLEIPTDRPRPPVQTYRAGTLPLVAPREAVAALRTLAQREGATLFMALLAAFKLVIARYTGQDDIVIGTPIAGRTQAETERLIGFFANTLALRTDLGGNPSFRELLGRVRETALGAFGHQDTPFEQIVDALHVERHLSYTPLFQISFMLQNTPAAALDLADLTAEPYLTETLLAKFDLQLGFWEIGDELHGEILYNADLYDAATIERLARHFFQLLRAAAAQPDRPVMLLPLLSEAEQQALLRAQTPAPAAAADDRPLHAIFEAQAARTPDAIALTGEHEQLTYSELNRRANRLAHQLRALGVGPDMLVGLCVERGPQLIVGLLAILKAGGAYVPLDPSYPAERIAFMLEDARATVVVTEERWRDSLAAHGAQIVCLDSAAPADPRHDQNPQPVATADHLAYVIFTSGSTGRPKGVLVTHANVARLFSATEHWFRFGPADVWTLFHSSAFDFSVWEIWGALLYGGRLVVVPYLTSRSPDAFYDLLQAEQVTVLNQTPSAFRQLMHVALERPAPHGLALRYVIFGGEALELQSLQPWFDRFGDAQPQLVNMYGITETTVHVTYRPIRAADLSAATGSMIGEPIPDLQVYVLDRYQQLAPLGVAGEMFVGGAGVARGYLNRPTLTAERFIADPFSDAPSARLYRTGDLARRLPNGDLQYLGRIDHQVKIRGFRIELGEIEAALRQHPAVRDVAVIVREDAPGDKRLAAYVVAGEEPRADGSGSQFSVLGAELRAFLQPTLPDYMIPAVFVLLPALPLTPTGKLDRRALPAPDQERPELAEAYVAPRTPTEELLTAIWADVLQISRVGVHDNFFSLGGDSMRSVQILGQARARGMHFSLQQLFQHQTVAALAPHVELEGGVSAPGHAAPFSMISEADRALLPPDIEDAYPLTMLQAGMLYHMVLLPDAPDYHNVDSFYYRGVFNLELFRMAAQRVVERQPILRTAFDLSTYSEPLQLVHKTAFFDITCEDIRHLSTAEQEQLIRDYVRQETTRLFDFARPPLLRYRIHLRSDDSFQFTLTECHAILDGWSLSTVSAETFANYFSLLDHGKLLDQEPLSSAFRDFVLQERTALQSEAHQRYWLSKLEDASFLRLPRWSEARPDAPRAVQRHVETIQPSLLEGLQQLVMALGVPLKTVLLTAHMRIMSMISGQSDILTGYTTHGRLAESDGERVCGLFLNVLPLRQQIAPGSWNDLIRATFDGEYEALNYRHYPMAAVQQQLGRGELFAVTFNYTHFRPIADLEQPDRLENLGFTITSEPANHGLVVSFYLDPVSDQLLLFLQYHAPMLQPEQVERIAGYYVAALSQMAYDRSSRHDLANLLSEREADALLRVCNATARDYPRAACFHELFEAQAASTPEAVAAMYDEQRLSYGELNRRANQLAHELRALGVGPDTFVGIFMERSLELLIGVLGVLKAGGAYVPLDPSYPQDRLDFMLSDAHITVLLTQQRLLERLPQAAHEPICLDLAADRLAQRPTANLPVAATPETIAYMIYTSGSTGRPKGVMIPQRGLVNYVSWASQAYRMAEGAGSPVHSPIGFDLTVTSLLAPLTVGQRVILLPEDQGLETLSAALHADAGLSVVKLTPAHVELLNHTLPAESLAGRAHALIIGGEALRAETVAFWREHAPATRLINEYGPTETVVGCCVYEVAPTDALGATVPIGRPIANTQLYVLDRYLQPAPFGVDGELYVGGDGVGRGYLNRPDLTAERFIPDPWSVTPGARLYRTGDVVRRLPDGVLEYLGRSDDQVKIRGFRIEPDEIAAVLLQHPAVSDAVVVVREDVAGDPRLAAYIVPEVGDQGSEVRDEQAAPSSFRDFLAQRLPDYMIPSAFVALDALPLTSNGKVDRKALPAPEQPAPTQIDSAPQTEIEELIASVWREVLHLDYVGIHETFFDLGGHSLLLIQAHSRLRKLIDHELKLIDMFTYPTVATLAAYVSQAQPGRAEETQPALEIERRAAIGSQASPSVAIIGMAGRFADAPDIEAFWQRLRDGVELIQFFSEDEVIAAGVDPQLVRDPHYVKAGGMLQAIDQFDATFFGMSPREAELTDPQQRFFLECAWEALEHAGYAGETAARIGVYSGSTISMYLFNNLYPQRATMPVFGNFQATTGNDKDYLATRVSYKLNLKGPSLSVQTACSTSLVAVHLACQSLLSGECDLALAGGVSIRLLQKRGYHHQEGGVISPDGHCRAFDEHAAGTVDGDGVGIVVLKRLDQALADGDQIYAVIKGSAINNDGALKIGYSAPSVAGQAEVITAAQAVAGVAPETIGYVEAHGTGTPLGDPIEVAALNQVFGARALEPQSCALGSVKTNIGHLDAAAGVAGLIKTTLALRHRQIPPSLHFDAANPQIDFAQGPFYVNTALRDWPQGATPRRAGVSSFGIGGTNAHVVLEEAPERAPSGPSRPWQLLTLSARTSSALTTAKARLAAHLTQHPEQPLADVAYTLQAGRKAFAHRLSIVCQDHADAIRVLEQGDATRAASATVADSRKPSLVWMFPGQGAQYIGMGRELYQHEPVFRAAVDRCAERLQPHLELDLRDVLYPADAPSEEQTRQLNQTWLAQPALFVVEYALAQLLLDWGLEPAAMIGHSIGEYVAAMLAGVFALDDALALVALRGRLMQQCAPGAMISVPLAAEDVRPLLGDDLALAAVNGPQLCVVAGPEEAITRISAQLAAQEIEVQRLHTSHAFHSALMEPIVERFAAALAEASLNPPQRPYLSNLTGTWITAAEATDPHYWARHLRETVQFAAGVTELRAQPDRILLELGPGRALSTLVRRQFATGAQLTALATTPHARDQHSDLGVLLHALGQLWLSGVAIDWRAVSRHEQRQRVALPTYPFERQRYWIEAQTIDVTPVTPAATLDKRPDLADWFYAPFWQQSAPPVETGAPEAATWLLFLDQAGLGAQIEQRLKEAGQTVVTVTAGAAFAQLDDDRFAIRPQARQDYDRLLDELRTLDRAPNAIVHLDTLTSANRTAAANGHGPELSDFYSLVYLAQALADQQAADLHLTVVTNGLHAITGAEALDPTKALLLGPLTVLSQEYPAITTGSIDVSLPELASWHAEQLAEQIVAELRAGASGAVAYRNGARWVQRFEQVQLPAQPRPERLRERGVYLITGGLGGIGLELAGYLARTVQARLVLIGRSTLPERAEWERWLTSHSEHDAVSGKLRAVEALEAAGAEVLILSADVADQAQMERVIAETYARFGALHGVIHTAGVAGGGVIPLQTPDQIAPVLAPKVQGTIVLDRVLAQTKLDLLALCSSLRSITGGPGQMAYHAANAFQDHYAHYARAQRGPAVVAINWGTWSETGMSAAAAARVGDFSGLADGMTSEEGVAAFQRVLGGRYPQVAVSPQALEAVIEQERINAAARLAQSAASSAAPTSEHGRPELPSAYVGPTNEREQLIVMLWQEALGIAPIGIHDSFFDLGGDSIVGLQIAAKAKRLGLTITSKHIFEYPTIAELATQVSVATLVQSEQGLVSGDVPLTPIQQWFFELPLAARSHWNQSLLLSTPAGLRAEQLERALARVVQHHDALRLRFIQTESGWRQHQDAAPELPLRRVELAGLTPEARTALIERTAAEQQARLDLTDGPILRAVFFDGGQEPGRLLLVVHHLAVDVLSWQILLEDLETAYRQLSQGASVALPLKTTSFKRWAERLAEYGRSAELEDELRYWQTQAADVARLPRDLPAPDAENTVAASAHVAVALSAEATARLQELALSRRVHMHEILLAALALTCAEWSGQPRIAVEMEGHGREDLFADADVSRTVGWFTSAYPIYLALGGAARPHDALQALKEQLRAIPGRGFGYGVLRYLSADPGVREQMAALPRPEINFLYLGQRDQQAAGQTLFGAATESSGPNQSPLGQRTHLLEIGASISAGQLQIDWGYSTRLHHRTTIERLAQQCLTTLLALSDDADAPAPQLSPSDFPFAQLSQQDLDDLVVELDEFMGDTAL